MLALVLSGGGSRGALQIGALEVLLEAGIQPDMIIGTSAGALNAAFFAADPTLAGLQNLRSIWLEMSDKEIYPGSSPSVLWNILRGRAGLFENGKMHNLLLHYLPMTRFSDLSLPCYAIAVDVDSGEIVAFGDSEDDLLADGLMSSTALAPAHPPWMVGERRFLDGGFVANLPVRQAIERGATDIIALNLTATRRPREKVRNALEIMGAMTDLMIRRQTQCDLEFAEQHANILQIDLESDISIPISDFSQTVERLERGRQVAVAILQTQPDVLTTFLPQNRVADTRRGIVIGNLLNRVDGAVKLVNPGRYSTPD